MEATFITIHDLSPEARILYCSESIVDVLGYAPEEVVNRPCWDFFHPEELPLARARHGQGIELDKAAVLAYCRMEAKDGSWVGCELVFTVSYDCLVGCTSIYRNGPRSQNRAANAPPIRRLFSNSPRDLRYHMLSHLSSKFEVPKHDVREPRAALFLNRYTRTLTIMYATDGLSDLLGISGEELMGRSFYFCIQENCLQDAVRCLENSKANDSIAYLRFWYRDPRQDDCATTDRRYSEPDDEVMEDVRSSDDDIEKRDIPLEYNTVENGGRSQRFGRSEDSRGISSDNSVEPTLRDQSAQAGDTTESRTSSHESNPLDSHEAVFGDAARRDSSCSSPANSSGPRHASNTPPEDIELEAVVSCASDGLVVTLRQARPIFPQAQTNAKASQQQGLFAVPWSPNPILPPIQQRMRYSQSVDYTTESQGGLNQINHHEPVEPQVKLNQNDFMNTIREIAVFAWALVGINGSLAEYGRGQPSGTAQPPSGLPIWKPDAREQQGNTTETRGETLIQGIPESGRSLIGHNGTTTYSKGALGRGPSGQDLFGDPGLGNSSRNR